MNVDDFEVHFTFRFNPAKIIRSSTFSLRVRNRNQFFFSFLLGTKNFLAPSSWHRVRFLAIGQTKIIMSFTANQENFPWLRECKTCDSHLNDQRSSQRQEWNLQVFQVVDLYRIWKGTSYRPSRLWGSSDAKYLLVKGEISFL